MLGKELLDGSDGEVELKICEEYAKKYKYRKEKEELNRLKEEFGSEPEDESSSEPEDETGELLNPELSGQIMNTVSMIRNRNPAIYDEGKKFFTEEQLKERRALWKKTKKEALEKIQKPMNINDYQRERVLGLIDESSDEEKPVPKHKFSYNAEQEAARQDLRNAFNNEDENGDLLTLKKKSVEEINKEEEEYRDFIIKSIADGGEEMAHIKNVIEGKENEEEKFLMEYILNRGWIDKEQKPINLEESSDYEEAEQFERKHNFRYEEEGGGELVSYPRNIENLVRRPDERRIQKRKRRSEKKKEELSKKKEELNRYKALKKKELNKRLKLIEQYTNVPIKGLKKLDLEADFDAEKFDAQMSQIFDDKYYNEKDDLEEQNEFEPEIIDSPKEIPESNGKSKRSKKKSKILSALGKGGKIDPKKLSKYSFKDAVDELLNMDFEDVAGGQATRFRYTRISPLDHGLDVEDILDMDDNELNSLVPLSRIAPYRDPELSKKDAKKLARKMPYKKAKLIKAPRLKKKKTSVPQK